MTKRIIVISGRMIVGRGRGIPGLPVKGVGLADLGREEGVVGWG